MLHAGFEVVVHRREPVGSVSGVGVGAVAQALAVVVVEPVSPTGTKTAPRPAVAAISVRAQGAAERGVRVAPIAEVLLQEPDA